jgi:hypothetical protein
MIIRYGAPRIDGKTLLYYETHSSDESATLYFTALVVQRLVSKSAGEKCTAQTASRYAELVALLGQLGTNGEVAASTATPADAAGASSDGDANKSIPTCVRLLAKSMLMMIECSSEVNYGVKYTDAAMECKYNEHEKWIGNHDYSPEERRGVLIAASATLWRLYSAQRLDDDLNERVKTTFDNIREFANSFGDTRKNAVAHDVVNTFMVSLTAHCVLIATSLSVVFRCRFFHALQLTMCVASRWASRLNPPPSA